MSFLDTIERITREEFDAAPDTAASMHRARQQRYYRSGHYRRPKSSRGGIIATLLDKPLCGIDGEGKSRVTGRHDYTLLAASWPDGRHAIESYSLTTRQCLDFLLDLPEDHTYVGYGLSYDMNMWLRDIEHKYMDRLLDTGKVNWRGYRIEWIERKYFRVAHAKQSLTVYDVLANFQTTFVLACKAWGVGTPAELELVTAMKEQRGQFDSVSDSAINEYCYLECDLLRSLCRKLFDAILQLPYRPRAVYGPGALAAAAFEKHGIKKHLRALPDDIQPLTHYAYFGGRFDISMSGFFDCVWQYDIKSAYPDQIRHLPCLTHAEWRKLTRPKGGFTEVPKYGLFHVEWNVPDDSRWTPFPFRTPKGLVYYPLNGEGWYHGDEVNAALELFGNAYIKVTHGYELVPGCEHKPFEFVDGLFNVRKTMPYDQGIVLKLILNSLYGKLAQQVGGRNGKPPPFQSFYWAGAITAGTRAKILRGLSGHPANVIGIATDSLVALRAISELHLGSELGEWDAKQLSHFAQISNGVYHGTDEHGKPVERSRGLSRSTLDWDAIERHWIATYGAGKFAFTTKSRFITRREARNYLDRSDIECTWLSDDHTLRKKSLNFLPTRRWPGTRKRTTRVLEALTVDQIEPPVPAQSQPFRLKTSWQEVHDARAEHFDAYSWQTME